MGLIYLIIDGNTVKSFEIPDRKSYDVEFVDNHLVFFGAHK
jgi:hypothetical protein